MRTRRGAAPTEKLSVRPSARSVPSAGAVFAVTRRFLPTLVVAIVGTLAGAMLLGAGAITLGIVVALFALTGVKRALDEPRMREIEASTGWDRTAGGTT